MGVISERGSRRLGFALGEGSPITREAPECLRDTDTRVRSARVDSLGGRGGYVVAIPVACDPFRPLCKGRHWGWYYSCEPLSYCREKWPENRAGILWRGVCDDRNGRG